MIHIKEDPLNDPPSPGLGAAGAKKRQNSEPEVRVGICLFFGVIWRVWRIISFSGQWNIGHLRISHFRFLFLKTEIFSALRFHGENSNYR
jgi:hypothetical protein